MCVAQPPGFGNDRLDIGKPKWRKRAELLSALVRWTDYIQHSILTKSPGTESKLEGAKFGCLCLFCTVFMLVFMWARDYVEYAFSVSVAACVWLCAAELTHNPSAPS